MKVARKDVTKALGDAHIERFSCKADGTVELMRSYYYRSGTVEGFAQACSTKLGEGWTLVGSEDRWRAWPTTSYFVAIFRRK